MTITMKINGRQVTVDVQPHETLLDVLRNRFYITGPKEGCGNGECGACTIIYNGKVVNSCLVLAPEADGAEILTVEGLTDGKSLHPVQEAFIEENAFQCGFCTPGFVISTKALLDRNPNPTDEEIIEALAGNLCRCTGYQTILRAVKKAAQKLGVEK